MYFKVSAGRVQEQNSEQQKQAMAWTKRQCVYVWDRFLNMSFLLSVIIMFCFKPTNAALDEKNNVKHCFGLIVKFSDERAHVDGLLEREQENHIGAPSPVRRLAYVKSHKTASSTLGGILFRYAVHHHLRILRSPSHLLGKSVDVSENEVVIPESIAKQIPVDVVLNHVTAFRLRSTFANWTHFYEKVIGGTDFVYLTSVREPVSHYLSWYNYMILGPKRDGKPWTEHEHNEGLRNALNSDNNHNILAREYGINSSGDLKEWLKKYAGHFPVIVVSDDFEGSLASLSILYNW